MNTSSAVSIKGLTHRFGKQIALDALSVNITRGCITGLVGPDGAGKTTLMRILAGLIVPTEGTLRVEGVDPIRNTSLLHQLLGYMPQKFGLYEDLSVQENLALYADLRGITGEARQQSFQTLLNFTNLHPFMDRLAGKLSGGMKQKLGLACTLLGSPRLLLLDEPSVGVDPISRRELWQMVQKLVDDGMTVIWSTSYLDEAEQCAEVMLMNEGQLKYAGTPSDLIHSMSGRTIQIRDIEPSKRRQVLKQALNTTEVIDGTLQGQAIRLVLRQPHQPPELTHLDANTTAYITDVAPRLEDAFIDLLGGGPNGNSVLADHMQPIVLPDHLDADALIEAKYLTKRFGTFTATNNVSFNVKRGEVFGLLGPNGAGKSTTFKMLCGLLRPTSGEAHVMGINLKQSASSARQQLGYMAQKFSLYGALKVQQNLTFFSGIYKLRGAKQRAVIEDMVHLFGLEPYLNQYTNTLPLGFKQRLALACALMHNPPLLFLDEPTSGVDPITRREFWTHINGLVGKGVTVMVTTHFMDEAEYCDRIALIYQGNMIAHGSPDTLKQQAGSEDLTMEEAFIQLIQQYDQERTS